MSFLCQRLKNSNRMLNSLNETDRAVQVIVEQFPVSTVSPWFTYQISAFLAAFSFPILTEKGVDGTTPPSQQVKMSSSMYPVSHWNENKIRHHCHYQAESTFSMFCQLCHQTTTLILNYSATVNNTSCFLHYLYDTENSEGWFKKYCCYGK